MQGGRTQAPVTDLARRRQQREVVDAFLAAARAGDFEGLLAVLDPDVVVRRDAALIVGGRASEVRGAAEAARQAVSRGARAARPALIDGEVGVVIAPRGRLLLVLRFTIEGGRVVAIDAVGEPERLRTLELAVLDE